MTILYISLYKNRMTVRNLDDSREYSGSGAFSNQRLLVAQFFAAHDVLYPLIQQQKGENWLARLLKRKCFRILVDAMELNEGGLSQVEERAIMEMVASAVSMRYRQLEVRCSSHVRNDVEVRALLANSTS